jgi:hypothetical protein
VNATADSSSSNASTPVKPRHGILRRLIGAIGIGFLGLIITGMTLWMVLAIYFADTHDGPRTFRAVIFAIAILAVLLFVRPQRYGLVLFAIFFAVVLGWFFSLKASNDRDWAPDVAMLPWAQIDGDHVTLHNVRNFDYRTETDFTPHWEVRHYDLSKVRSGDFILVYWGSKAIAHAMVSIGFDDGKYLAMSIETRKEKSQSYSTVQGFFRQYALIYIFADERDLIRLRTNYRKGEEVYLYHTTLTPTQARDVFVTYLQNASALKEHPQFYNALTSNCATNVVTNVRQSDLPAKMTWKILLDGYAAAQAYGNGRLDTSMPFEKLEAVSHINAAARAADKDPEFSQAIRVGLPIPANVASGTVGTHQAP